MTETKSRDVMENKKVRFQQKIFEWWEQNKRDFPWRNTRDPYNIMVSEVMLQQTQVSRVIPKYNAFITRFPTITELSKAKTSEILELWSGLGYNKRALWLQEAAREIVRRGEFPRTPEQLEQLKGIGAYTSRSILIFAFNLDIAAVDTNVRRILIHEGFAREETPMKDLQAIAEELVPKGRSRDWHNALMDYGSLVVTARKTRIKPTSKQSKFKGSTREARGKIMKAMVKHKSLSVQALKDIIGLEEDYLHVLLEQLARERLVVITNDGVKLPE